MEQSNRQKIREFNIREFGLDLPVELPNLLALKERTEVTGQPRTSMTFHRLPTEREVQNYEYRKKYAAKKQLRLASK